MTAPLTIVLPTERTTRVFARRLAPCLARGDLVVLVGPLGSGKTFFARALCRALGLPSRVRVPSPTFTLVHEYETEPPVCHADVYRLGSALEVAALGLDVQREEGRVLLVEWGDRYLAELGGDGLIAEFALDPRRVTLRATGPRSTNVLEQLGRCYNDTGGHH